MAIEHFSKIKALIREADEIGLLCKTRNLTGFSGEKLVGTLQRIAKYQADRSAGCYLEVGVFKGLSLLSVASVLCEERAYGIDNFSQFDPGGKNERIIAESARGNGLHNVRLINSDYEDALENLGVHIGDSKVGLYFVDGPHDYRSQLVCLQLAKPYLSDLAVIVVDDCNYRHVRLANRDFLIANQEYKLLFEAYTKCHPANMGKGSEWEMDARKGWWNGVNVIVHDPQGELHRMVPETMRERTLYENEHLVHSAQYGFLALDAVACFQSVISFKLWRALKGLVRMGIKARHVDRHLLGCYESMNTFSEGLPMGQFNEKLP